MSDVANAELEELPGDEYYLQVHRVSLGSRPVRVITAAQHRQETIQAQEQLLTLSSNARQIFASSRNAHVQFDEPQLVLSAIREAATSAQGTHDPFVGKWRLDVSRSTIVDSMKVEAPSQNTYRFNFEGAPAETIVADGTDQPGITGTTLSVKAADGRTLTVVRKQGGRIVISAAWKLSRDGRTLRDAFTSVQPDGSSVTVDYLYRRTSGTSGFAGAWESTTKPLGLKVELEIQPYGNDGLSFVSPGSNKKVTFDGRDHVAAGAKAGSTLSGRRLGALAMEYTEKNRGKVERARQFELSRDGTTLTETLRTAGQTTPDVFVFARE